VHLHWLTLDHSRFELPLFHGGDRGIGQQALAADQPHFADRAIKASVHIEHYQPLDLLLAGFLWIFRLNTMKQATLCHCGRHVKRTSGLYL
jgi:hypothetical protein